MTVDVRETLRDTLLARRGELVTRLTRRTGSAELAEEALQDTWLRLQHGGDLGAVRNPLGYVFRIALNIARDRTRSDSRRASAAAIEAALEIPDDAPGPAAIAEGRSELAALDRALAELPARRRAIFLAAWGDGEPHRDIAARLGLSVRMIDIELARAREHCFIRLKKRQVVPGRRFQWHRRETSDE